MCRIHFLEARKITIGLKSSFRSSPALTSADYEHDNTRSEEQARRLSRSDNPGAAKNNNRDEH